MDAADNLPLIQAIQDRWSPYDYEPRGVETDKLKRCLQAAQWAPSSYNEQPWSFIVAARENESAFQKVLHCLLEANQAWASQAGVLILTVVRTTFRQNGKPNRVALHDLGAAAAFLALQATAEGLQAHQMAGLNLSQVRLAFEIPDGHEPQTAIALGYPNLNPADPEHPLASRDRQPRNRMDLDKTVFSDRFGNPATFTK
jgi:nitroreductase